MFYDYSVRSPIVCRILTRLFLHKYSCANCVVSTRNFSLIFMYLPLIFYLATLLLSIRNIGTTVEPSNLLRFNYKFATTIDLIATGYEVNYVISMFTGLGNIHQWGLFLSSKNLFVSEWSNKTKPYLHPSDTVNREDVNCVQKRNLTTFIWIQTLA